MSKSPTKEDGEWNETHTANRQINTENRIREDRRYDDRYESQYRQQRQYINNYNTNYHRRNDPYLARREYDIESRQRKDIDSSRYPSDPLDNDYVRSENRIEQHHAHRETSYTDDRYPHHGHRESSYTDDNYSHYESGNAGVDDYRALQSRGSQRNESIYSHRSELRYLEEGSSAYNHGGPRGSYPNESSRRSEEGSSAYDRGGPRGSYPNESSRRLEDGQSAYDRGESRDLHSIESTRHQDDSPIQSLNYQKYRNNAYDRERQPYPLVDEPGSYHNKSYSKYDRSDIQLHQSQRNDGLSRNDHLQSQRNDITRDGLSRNDHLQSQRNDGLSRNDHLQSQRNDGLSRNDPHQSQRNDITRDGLSRNDHLQSQRNDGLSRNDPHQSQRNDIPRDGLSRNDLHQSLNRDGSSRNDPHPSHNREARNEQVIPYIGSPPTVFSQREVRPVERVAVEQDPEELERSRLFKEQIRLSVEVRAISFECFRATMDINKFQTMQNE